jgi:type III secretory pathway component EscS
MFEIYLKQAFLVTLVVSGIPLLASALSGMIVGVIQTATQIQEQSISFVVRFGVISLVFAVLFEWFASQLVQFLQQLLLSLPSLGRIV